MVFTSSGGTDKIEIVVEVDEKGAVRDLKEVGKAAQEVGKEANAASSGLAKFQTNLITVATLAAAAAIAVKGISMTLEAVDAGSRVDDIANSFDRLSKQAGVASEQLRSNLSSALGGTFTQVEVMRKANELLIAGLDPSTFDEMANAARSLADATGVTLKQALDQIGDSFIRGTDRALKAMGVHIDLQKAETDYAIKLGITREQLTENQRLEVSRAAMLEALSGKTQELGIVTNDASDQLLVIKARVSDFTDQLTRAIATSPELNELINTIANFATNTDFTPLINGITNTIGAISNLTTKLLGTKQDLEDFALGLRVIGLMISGNGLNASQSIASLEKLGKESQKVSDEFLNNAKPNIEKLEQSHEDLSKTVTKTANDYQGLGKKAAIATVAITGSTAATKEIKASADIASKSIVGLADSHVKLGKELDNLAPKFDSLLDKAMGFESGSKGAGISSSLQSTIGSAISKGVDEGFNRNDITAVAASAGEAIGTAFAGPIGGAILKAVTEHTVDTVVNVGTSKSATSKFVKLFLNAVIPGLGYGFDKFFGDKLFGTSAATQMRKQADKFFADVFDANKIAVSVNGQLSRLTDLVFSGNQDPTSGIFAGLSASTQAQFTTLGDGLAQALGLGKDAAINLGVVLANNNVTLADLQTIIQATGQSFETLSDQMFESFYLGNESVLQLQQRLQDLYGIMSGTNVFQDLGAAFDAVGAAGFKGGRQLFNALQAVGIEAQQLGANTLPQMADILVNRFGAAASTVQTLMAAMTAAGIRSVADLASATNAQLTAIGANQQLISQGLAPTEKAVIPPGDTSRSNFGTTTQSSKNPGTQSTRSSGATKSKSKAQIKAEKLADEKKREKSRQIQEVERLLGGSNEYRSILDNLTSSLITNKTAEQQLDNVRKSITTNVKELSDAEKKRDKLLNAGKKVPIELTVQIEKLRAAQDKLRESSKKLIAESPYDRLAKLVGKYAGNIDLLNLAAQQSGISFDQLKDKAQDAFLSGNESFTQAKKRLDDLTGGTDVKKQFENFVNAGTNGGILSKDFFQKIGKSLQNVGGTSLESLSENLLGSGVSAEQLQKIFIALKNTGIESIDAIANIDTTQFIKFGDQLQQIGFAFNETSSETRRLTEELNAIPDRKSVTLDVSLNLTEADRKILEGYGIITVGQNGVVPNDTTAAPQLDKSNKGLPTKVSLPKGLRATSRKGIYRNSRNQLVDINGRQLRL